MNIKSLLAKHIGSRVLPRQPDPCIELAAPGRLEKLRRKFNDTLFFPNHIPLLYVSNAKAACSTIKRSIWHATSPDTLEKTSNVHDRKEGPFVESPFAVRELTFPADRLAKFSVVRNPYSKFVSAYRNKIDKRNWANHAWVYISKRYGFPADACPSMETLLRCIADDDPYWVEAHFACQTVNLSVGLINLDFIGQMERMEDVETFLTAHDVPLMSDRKHATKAGAIEDFTTVLSRQEIDLIGEIYADDFATFHYSLDPRQTAPTAMIEPEPASEDLLKLLLGLSAARNGGDLEAAITNVSAQAPDLVRHPLFQPDTSRFARA